MKFLCVAVLSGLLVLGVSASVIAQQSGASSSAQSEATKPADDKAMSPGALPSAPAPDRSSSSSSTTVDVLKSEPRTEVGKDKSDLGSASPRTTVSESRRIFGLEPTAAILIGAAILLVVILALVAMSRGGETSSHTDIDLNRRL